MVMRPQRQIDALYSEIKSYTGRSSPYIIINLGMIESKSLNLRGWISSQERERYITVEVRMRFNVVSGSVVGNRCV